jgi:diguanylate cyclase (GGDEF)-like protein
MRVASHRLLSWKASARAGLGLVPLLVLLLAGALGSVESIGQSFPVKLFGPEDGLDNRAITALAQHPDGHLWVATENGLFRYNGAHFRKFGRADGFQEPRFFNLYIDKTGTVWASTPSGLYFFDEHRFQEVQFNGKLLLVGINTRLASTNDGEVIVSDSSGRLLSIVRDSPAKPWSVVSFRQRHPDFPWDGYVDGVFVDGTGTLWFGCQRTICRYRPSQPGNSGGDTRHVSTLDEIPDGSYDSFFEDRSGRMWARSGKHLVSFSPSDHQARDLTADLPASAFQTFNRRITQDSFGNILVVTNTGFATGDGSTWQETVSTSRGPFNEVSDLLSDSEGSLWVGTGGLGLFQSLGYKRWQNFDAQSGLSSSSVYAIAHDSRGQAWVGTNRGLSILPKGATRFLDSPLRNEPDSTWIENLVPSSDGGMWAANLNGRIWHIDPRNHIDVRALVPYQIQRIRLAPNGDLWAGTASGIFTLHCLQGTPCKPQALQDPLIKADFIADMSFDGDGTLWIVGNRGLYRLRNGLAERLQIDGSPNRFSLIAPGADHTLWLAGHLPGVIRVSVQGNLAKIVESHATPELSSDYVEFLDTSADGKLWIGSDHGVNVLDGKAISNITDQDGLIWNDTDWKGFLSDPDGSVWIGTSEGLSHLLDPASILTRPPFAGIIEDVSYDGKPIYAQSTTLWNNGVLIVHFSGITFRDNRDMVFHYKLNGFDSNEISTSFPFVRFQQLPPGNFTLAITAEDTAHHVSSSPATFTFTLTPPWWKSWYFHSFLVLLAAALAALLWHWRHLALIAQKDRLESLVAERTTELHQLAVTDALTGVLNRGAIMDKLTEETIAARKNSTPLCVAIVDLDHFKRVNDSLGHLAGDQVLREAARRLSSSVRATDAVGRYGGEEFLIIFRDVQKELGKARCEAIRKAVCASPIPFDDNELTITASIGVAWTESNIEVEDALVALADQALYRAKGNGRNRVELASTEFEPEPEPETVSA